MSEENEVKDPEGLLKAYNKAKADLVELRTQITALEASKKELEDARVALDENLNAWKTSTVELKALEELTKQGIKNPERILKYIQLDGVDLDENKKITGLDDKIKTVKTDFPELFDVKARAARTSVDIHADKPVEKALTGTEAQMERLMRMNS